MLAIVGILLVAGVILAIDLPYMQKKQLTKELWVSTILLVFGTGLSVAEALDVPVPTPLDALYTIYQPYIQMMDKVFPQ